MYVCVYSGLTCIMRTQSLVLWCIQVSGQAICIMGTSLNKHPKHFFITK